MVSKRNRRKKLKLGIRNKISGTGDKPRLSVFRSNKAIYCQLIDDTTGRTICSSSSIKVKGTNKTETAKLVGKELANLAKSNNINTIIFDRSGYLYHGRVKALAEGAREEGLIF